LPSRVDHTVKHDPDTGWAVIQTSPGRFAWTAPTGRSHIREPEPYDPLPDPIPRSEPADPAGLMFDPPPPTPPPGSPRPNTHGHLTRAALDTAARLRQRTHNNAAHDGESEPNPDDRFPEEPPF
jgi:hypothetical protein